MIQVASSIFTIFTGLILPYQKRKLLAYIDENEQILIEQFAEHHNTDSILPRHAIG